MFAVYWTIKAKSGETTDYYHTHEDKGRAKAHYNIVLNNPNLYAAGMGPIFMATEPHWIEDGENTGETAANKESYPTALDYVYEPDDRLQPVRRLPNGDKDTTAANADVWVCYDWTGGHRGELRSLEEWRKIAPELVASYEAK